MTAVTSLSSDEELFKKEVASFVEAQVQPFSQEMDVQQEIKKDLIPKFFEMGLMGIEIPESLGGSGGSFFMSCLAVEEISKVDPAIAVIVDVQNTLVNNIIARWANETQQSELFPKLAQNQLGAFCLTEPDSGSDAFALQTRATQDGSDWIIKGKKIFITNAQEADLFIVFANIDPSKGYKGITAFLVERSMPGFKVGKKEDKLGIRASSTCEVLFENVRVPEKNIIGSLGKGYKVAIETLNEGRIGIAAQMLGLAQGAFNNAYRYAHERSQFGKSIASFQAVQFELAKQASEIEVARLLVYNAARLKDDKKPFAKEAAIAKYMCSEIAERVASAALEIYGGYGFIKEFPAEKFYRDVKIGKLYEGTTNMQLATIYKMLGQ